MKHESRQKVANTVAPAANRPVDAAESDQSLTKGIVQCRTLCGDSSQQYFIYVPAKLAKVPKLLVTVHGISRNAKEHARAFAANAEQSGVVVVAPLFPASRFSKYQRLGQADPASRADIALLRIVKEVSCLVGIDTQRFLLFGYSGGGQFAHRFVMAYPERVEAAAIGAAGWYTFPNANRRFPHGIKAQASLPDIQPDPASFLKVPVTVLVGAYDIFRTPDLNTTRRVDRNQGHTRVERGRRWVRAMTKAARTRQLPTSYQFELLGNARHSFLQSTTRHGLADRVFELLLRRQTASGPELLCRWAERTLGGGVPEQAESLVQESENSI